MAPKDQTKKSLKDIARDKLKSNPSALGDPVSLKAETSDTQPTDQDKPVDENKDKSLKDLAKEKLQSGNPTQLGDPISLKAETADSHPTDQDRGASAVDPAKLGKPKL